MPSKVIRSFRYDAGRAELHIEFQSGRHYVYEGVPEETYRAMQASFSKGVFFNAHIREQFRCVEVVGERPIIIPGRSQ
jgi:KTSC domain